MLGMMVDPAGILLPSYMSSSVDLCGNPGRLVSRLRPAMKYEERDIPRGITGAQLRITLEWVEKIADVNLPYDFL